MLLKIFKNLLYLCKKNMWKTFLDKKKFLETFSDKKKNLRNIFGQKKTFLDKKWETFFDYSSAIFWGITWNFLSATSVTEIFWDFRNHFEKLIFSHFCINLAHSVTEVAQQLLEPICHHLRKYYWRNPAVVLLEPIGHHFRKYYWRNSAVVLLKVGVKNLEQNFSRVQTWRIRVLLRH